MRSLREATELKQFFAIRTDLAAAVRDQIQSVTEFHLNELVAMNLHTTSDRLRRATRKALSEHQTLVAVANA